MLLTGVFLLFSVVYPYVNAQVNSWEEYYAGRLNVVFPESAIISAGQTASFYCDAGLQDEDVAWFIDEVYAGDGHNLEVDSSVGVGTHEIYTLIAYWYGGEYPQVFDSNRAQLTVLPSSQPTPTPSQTVLPTSTVTSVPTATFPFPSPSASSNPVSDFFNDDASLFQSEGYKMVAGIACFPLIILGCITVFLAREKR